LRSCTDRQIAVKRMRISIEDLNERFIDTDF
jgi:hypothetical protein